MRNNKKVLKKRKNDLSFPDFQEKSSTEEACREYLFKKDGQTVSSAQIAAIPLIMHWEDVINYQCTRCKRHISCRNLNAKNTSFVKLLVLDDLFKSPVINEVSRQLP
jgi:hypothetical protein